MALKYLFTADPISRFQPKFDTTLRLMEELLSRGIEADYCDLSQADARQDSENYLSWIPVQAVKAIHLNSSTFIELGPYQRVPFSDYKVIFHRKDPPVDDFYKAHSTHYAKVPEEIIQVNNPSLTPFLSEHELPIDFPDFSIPTLRCESFDSFVAAVRAQEIEAVAKPMYECSGNGVCFFSRNAEVRVLREYWEIWKPAVIVQPYLDEITKSGDLRILVMNHEVLGSVLRVPKEGSRLANLHQGASGRAFTPTRRQLECVRVVADRLTPQGLYLLGLDFIGDYLSEINITSPSALAQINEVSGARIQTKLIDECEKLANSKLRY